MLLLDNRGLFGSLHVNQETLTLTYSLHTTASNMVQFYLYFRKTCSWRASCLSWSQRVLWTSLCSLSFISHHIFPPIRGISWSHKLVEGRSKRKANALATSFLSDGWRRKLQLPCCICCCWVMFRKKKSRAAVWIQPHEDPANESST